MWVCNECGNKQKKWEGSCGTCNSWNTFVEEGKTGHAKAKPVLIQEVDTEKFSRINTGFAEFDRLMGQGTVAGSLNLIGGEPGIGKSTLLLQLAHRYAMQGLLVLYVCGEESVEQTALRAKRLKINSQKLYLFSETLMSNIDEEIEKLRPDILILDSVQILFKDTIASAPGSVTQVKEIAMEGMRLAKQKGITTFLVGHVTKTGDLAGPRVLEHMVDTVLEFEGDRQHGFRLLRAVKNRFGPTDDVILFQMEEDGLHEVSNPSEAFLQERMMGANGSVIIPTLEGTRSLLIEAQALVSPSSYPTASRRSAGIDPKRLALHLAILEKRMGYQLHSQDIFVSFAGGLKVTEPAIDLGILIALASSFVKRSIDPHTVVVGEVGLSGEVRSVPRIETRLKEAINLGFKRVILPKRNLRGLSASLTQKIDTRPVAMIEEAISKLLG